MTQFTFETDLSADVLRQEFWDWAVSDLDAKAEAEAIASFEMAIADSMEIANCDRSTAIKYQIQAAGFEREYDPGYICHCFGLPYHKGYEDEFLTHLRCPEEDLAIEQMQTYEEYTA